MVEFCAPKESTDSSKRDIEKRMGYGIEKRLGYGIEKRGGYALVKRGYRGLVKRGNDYGLVKRGYYGGYDGYRYHFYAMGYAHPYAYKR